MVWHFCTCESIRKIEKIQKRCFRRVPDDYQSDYDIFKKAKYAIFNTKNKTIDLLNHIYSKAKLSVKDAHRQVNKSIDLFLDYDILLRK